MEISTLLYLSVWFFVAAVLIVSYVHTTTWVVRKNSGWLPYVACALWPVTIAMLLAAIVACLLIEILMWAWDRSRMRLDDLIKSVRAR